METSILLIAVIESKGKAWNSPNYLTNYMIILFILKNPTLMFTLLRAHLLRHNLCFLFPFKDKLI